MSVTQLHSSLTPAQQRIEAIIKAASDLGMGGFALAKLRTATTAQIEPLTAALETISRTTFSGSDMNEDYMRGNRDAHETCRRFADAALLGSK